MANYINGSELQKDVYSLLSGDLTLSALITGVYDEVPDAATFPYVTISEVVETADNTLHTFGRSTLLNIHVWSDYHGNKETQDIIGVIVPLMDKVKFSLSDSYNHVSTHLLDYQVLKDREEGIRHGVIRFRIYTNEK